MSRVFWDTMLFIYLLEDNREFAPRVEHLLARAYERGDRLYTSHLALGEIMAGAERTGDPGKPADPAKAAAIRATIEEMGFTFLPFDSGAVAPFGKLRAAKVKVADAIHLACAASAGIDLFLTGDEQLTRLNLPGVQFIAHFGNPIL